MSVAGTDRGLVASMVHSPRAVQRAVTTIAGCGFSIEELREMGERRGQPMRDAIVRAVERGEIDEVPDLSLVGDLLEGPLMHRRMIGRQPLTPDYLEAVARSTHHLLTRTTVET